MKLRRNPFPVSTIPLTMNVASARAARLSKTEIREAITPMSESARFLRAGVASEDHFVVYRTHVRIARAIEELRYFRGLSEHIAAALCACSAIHQRATANGVWTPVELTLEECDAIDCMLDLHDVQLHQLTGGEFHTAVHRVITEAKGEAVLDAAGATITTLEASA